MKLKNHSTDELVTIIFEAIKAEPYFSESVLKPKIRAIITAFRLDLSTKNYQKEGKPTDLGRLIRANEIKSNEVAFWKSKVRELVGTDNMQRYYDELDVKRAKWDNE